MLEKYIPMDTLLSFSRHIIFKIENILNEAGIPVIDFADFINTMLDDDYYNYQNDNLLMKLVYWYILDKVAIQTEEYLGETDRFIISSDMEISFMHPLEEHIEIEEVDGMISYICEEKDLRYIKKRLDLIPSEKQGKTVRWFISEFQRCTNSVF